MIPGKIDSLRKTDSGLDEIWLPVSSCVLRAAYSFVNGISERRLKIPVVDPVDREAGESSSLDRKMVKSILGILQLSMLKHFLLGFLFLSLNPGPDKFSLLLLRQKYDRRLGHEG